MSSETYHEPYELLSDSSKDRHRAILSLMEELEAIDWYQQRADVTTDAALKAVLLHNMREEIEHAMMTLEWLRRSDPAFDANARTYLFTEGEITEVEAAKESAASPAGDFKGSPPAVDVQESPQGAAPGASRDGSLGIGTLRG